MRARNLKPGFFKNAELADAGPHAQLLFAGLWLMADKEGRVKDQPRVIKAELFPYYDVDVNGELTVIERLGHVRRYVNLGIGVIEVINFRKHQSPHHTEKASELPAYDHASDCIQKTHEIHREFTCDPPFSNGEYPSDSLIPSSLIPDSLIPDSLIQEQTAKPLVEPSSTAKEATPRPLAKNEIVERVFEHWRTTHRHPHAQLDEKRRRVIVRALKHYAEADLCQAICGYLNSPHHMGQNDTGTVYDSLELMLRDSEHVDRGLKCYTEPPRTDLSPLTRRNVAAIADWQPPEMRNAAK